MIKKILLILFLLGLNISSVFAYEDTISVMENKYPIKIHTELSDYIKKNFSDIVTDVKTEEEINNYLKDIQATLDILPKEFWEKYSEYCEPLDIFLASDNVNKYDGFLLDFSGYNCKHFYDIILCYEYENSSTFAHELTHVVYYVLKDEKPEEFNSILNKWDKINYSSFKYGNSNTYINLDYFARAYGMKNIHEDVATIAAYMADIQLNNPVKRVTKYIKAKMNLVEDLFKVFLEM